MCPLAQLAEAWEDLEDFARNLQSEGNDLFKEARTKLEVANEIKSLVDQSTTLHSELIKRNLATVNSKDFPWVSISSLGAL